MNDKIEFVKWIFRNINYWYVAFFFHMIVCFLYVFVPSPYDKVIGIYILISITTSMLYMCVVMPLKWAYIEFKKQQTL